MITVDFIDDVSLTEKSKNIKTSGRRYESKNTFDPVYSLALIQHNDLLKIAAQARLVRNIQKIIQKDK